MTGGVLLCGAWDEGPGYPRTTALRQGLVAAGVPVRECRAPALGAQKRRLLAQPWRWPFWAIGEWLRRRRFRQRLRAAAAAAPPAFAVVPYPGHLYVRDVAATLRVPVVLDLFLSAFDTAVGDRGLWPERSLPARLLHRLDQRACAAADLVLLDTEEHADHVAALLDLPRERFAALPVGDPEAPATPAPFPPASGPLHLLFFGTGVPLHGLPTLIAAVRRTPDVELTLVGGTADERRLAADELGSRLVLLPPFVEFARLRRLIDGAELVAGVFGTTPKAQRVVPFKVVHALAAGRPVVTADTPAMRRFLGDGDGAFYVPAGDADALAARLLALAADRAALATAAAAARRSFDRHFAASRLGERWRELLARCGGAP